MLTFHRASPVESERDDLGRLTSDPDEGIEIPGSVTTPRRVGPSGEAIVSSLDAVAFIEASASVEITDDTWVEVTAAPNPAQLGSYSIEERSGGRRVIRLGLKRTDRRDGSSGGLQ